MKISRCWVTCLNAILTNSLLNVITLLNCTAMILKLKTIHNSLFCPSLQKVELNASLHCIQILLHMCMCLFSVSTLYNKTLLHGFIPYLTFFLRYKCSKFLINDVSKWLVWTTEYIVHTNRCISFLAFKVLIFPSIHQFDDNFISSNFFLLVNIRMSCRPKGILWCVSFYR